jgi:hypothetical protein
MDELKYAILVAATVLAARKLNEIGSRPWPVPERTISDATRSNAELILKIDRGWPRPEAVAPIEFLYWT